MAHDYDFETIHDKLMSYYSANINTKLAAIESGTDNSDRWNSAKYAETLTLSALDAVAHDLLDDVQRSP